MGRAQLLFLLLFALLLGCEPWIGEPAPMRGVYFLENLTSDRLLVNAQSHWGDVLDMSQSEVAPDETAEFYTVVNDADLSPSNAFGQLTVHRETVSEDTLVYSGLNNSDWTSQAGGEDDHGRGRVFYTLSIAEP